MDNDSSSPGTAKEGGFSLVERLIYALGFAIVAYLSLLLLYALAIAQFVVAALDQKPNAELKSFLRRLVRYQADVSAYIALASDVKPFPFAAFPSDMDV